MVEDEEFVAEDVSEDTAPQEETEEIKETETEISGETPKTPGFQKRINQLTAEKYREKQRADEMAAEIERLKQTQATPDTDAPKLSDFDYDEEKFLDAKVKYAVRRETQAAQTEAVRQQKGKRFQEKVARAKIPDYEEVVQNLVDTVPPPLAVVEAIQEDDNGPELAYYLGTHLDVAERLAGMSGPRAVLELGRISAGLAGVKQKKLTNAPKPVRPVGTGGATGAKDLAKLSVEEIMDLPEPGT